MPTLLDFRRRIRSVKSSQQITRAMKFVAAARLRRAQEAALAARPYAQELARLLRSVMSRIQDVSDPLMAQREEKNILAIVMTGERGLAGLQGHRREERLPERAGVAAGTDRHYRPDDGLRHHWRRA